MPLVPLSQVAVQLRPSDNVAVAARPLLRPLRVVNRVSDRPLASPVARWQAAHEDRENIVNLRHESAPVPIHVRKLLPFLDGSRDHEVLVEEMLGMCRRGVCGSDPRLLPYGQSALSAPRSRRVAHSFAARAMITA